jgi:methanogenic corrinoid protein MtbC1
MASTAGQYPIRAVARMTGLSVDTLRAWERRYQAVVPDRGDRGRVYSERHVDRLKHLAALVAHGHAIGSIAGLPDAALRRLRSGGDTAPARETALAIDLDSLLQAMKHYDLDGIDRRMTRLSVLLPPAELIFGVVLPVLREVGKRWEAGQITPAQEHLTSGIMRGVLGGLLRTMPRPARAPRIVFATPAGERHELGLLCAAVLAAAAGYAVVYLGPDLPFADITHAAVTAEARVLVLAGTVNTVAYDDVGKLKTLAARIAVWVGGARSADLRAAIGPRARHLASLEDFRGLLDRHAA